MTISIKTWTIPSKCGTGVVCCAARGAALFLRLQSASILTCSEGKELKSHFSSLLRLSQTELYFASTQITNRVVEEGRGGFGKGL